MFKIIQRYEIEDYFKQGVKVYQFYYYTRRDPIRGQDYAALCIADSITVARKQARKACRLNGYTLDYIMRYWEKPNISDTKLRGVELE